MDIPTELSPSIPRENTVSKTTVPSNDIRRGFTYFEQPFTEAAVANGWSGLVANSLITGVPVYGLLLDGVLRWSGDAPSHTFMMNPDAGTEAVEYTNPKIEIKPERGPRFYVSGSTKYLADLFKVAQYLRRNVRGCDEAMVLIRTYEGRGKNHFNGPLRSVPTH